MRLKTPEKLRRVQAALYFKAKREPNCRFCSLYDRIWCDDVLAHAYALCRSNGGAAGVDGQTFADVEAYGEERLRGRGHATKRAIGALFSAGRRSAARWRR
jgi:RNA-directed DNA polymerase